MKRAYCIYFKCNLNAFTIIVYVEEIIFMAPLLVTKPVSVIILPTALWSISEINVSFKMLLISCKSSLEFSKVTLADNGKSH